MGMEREIRAERKGDTGRAGARDQGHTYGGSPFRLRKTRTRESPRSRILSRSFPSAWGGDVGREELADPLTPELIAFRFREVGVSNQKVVPVPKDGPREQFIIGLMEERHGGEEAPGRPKFNWVLVYKTWWRDLKWEIGIIAIETGR